MNDRWDETWHRLREWTSGQAPSERLAAQVLVDARYDNIDPSHPLGGRDGGKDALCTKNGKDWIMAVYFPRGQKEFAEIRKKFSDDMKGVIENGATGIAFVTNQELTLGERSALKKIAGSIEVDLFHLERISAVLDKPSMAGIRQQYLSIKSDGFDVAKAHERLEGLQTGGDAFCYAMFYDFDLQKNIARCFTIIREGEFPLYDVRVRVLNIDTKVEQNMAWGEISAPAEYQLGQFQLTPRLYYRIFIHARNGQWHQDLQLARSEKSKCWLAATRVFATNGSTVRYEKTDIDFQNEFGCPVWR